MNSLLRLFTNRWCRSFLLLYLVCRLPVICHAQTDSIADGWVQYSVECLNNGEVNEEEAGELTDLFTLLSAAPLDINSVSVKELARLPFLNEFQIHSLVNHRLSHPEGFRSLFDLKMLPGWDLRTITLVRPFLTLKPKPTESNTNLLQRLRYDGRTEIAFTAGGALLHDKRYASMAGNSTAASLRLRHELPGRLSIGISADKDAGEAFSMADKGFDFYGFHAFYTSREKPLRQLALGDYRIGFGYGLMASQINRFFGSDAGIADRRQATLRPSVGINEDNFLRGAALTLSHNGWQFSVGASRRALDANIATDSTGEEYIRTLRQGGLHRTENERAGRHAVRMNTVFSQISHDGLHTTVALAALHYNWNGTPLFRPPGVAGIESLSWLTGQSNIGISYRTRSATGNLTLFGESAWASSDGLATYNGISAYDKYDGRYTISIRYISPRYWSYFANPDSRFRGAWNEYGLKIQFAKSLPVIGLLRTSADFFKSIEPRYGQTSPSKGSDIRLAATPVASEKMQIDLSLRRVELKDRYSRYNLAFTGHRRYSSSFSLRCAARVVSTERDNVATRGYALAVSGDWKPHKRFSCSIGSSFFRTDNFGNRLYIYEPSPRYVFSLPILSGGGFRIYGLIRRKIAEFAEISAKADYQSATKTADSHARFFLTLRIFRIPH